MKTTRVMLLAFLLLAVPALAAPAPKPPFPNKLVLTQGTQTQRFLSVPNQQCSQSVTESRTSGVRRFKLGNCAANGSFVQFPEDGGPIYSQWVYPAPPPPDCGAAPPPATQPGACPPGTVSHWTQTHDWVCANGTWVATPWTPPAPPLNDSCTPATPPPFQWTAPRPGSTFTMQARPAKGTGYASPYGLPVTRVTDHALDGCGVWCREDYNRRQSLNADDSLLAIYQPNGFWDAFDAHSLAFVKRLNGPAGDSEFQWDPSLPNIAYYLPINGGAVLYRLDVSSNTVTTQYDFTAAVQALWPSARRCWTKSEGSPSADGRLWGLMVETDSFAPLGYIVIDIVTKQIVWSRSNSIRPDNVTISPSGRWFVRSGNDSEGTKAYEIGGSRILQLHPGVEHADIGVLPNGHDFFVSFDYQTGVTFVTDIDIGPSSRRTLFPIYGNAWLDNVQPHPCANCAGHWSAKAFRKPGWALFGSYGTPPANIVAVNVVTGGIYGIGANYIDDGDYFDEPHCFVSRDFTSAYCNENWLASLSGDVVRYDIPALPVGTLPRAPTFGPLVAPPKVLPANVHRVKPTLIGK